MPSLPTCSPCCESKLKLCMALMLSLLNDHEAHLHCSTELGLDLDKLQLGGHVSLLLLLGLVVCAFELCELWPTQLAAVAFTLWTPPLQQSSAASAAAFWLHCRHACLSGAERCESCHMRCNTLSTDLAGLVTSSTLQPPAEKLPMLYSSCCLPVPPHVPQSLKRGSVALPWGAFAAVSS